LKKGVKILLWGLAQLEHQPNGHKKQIRIEQAEISSK